jgi:hypothetical protein
MLLALVGFFKGVGALNVNKDYIENNYMHMVFFCLLVAAFGVLMLFWTYLNLF